MARGSVQRRFPQRLRGSALALDYNHGVAETSPFWGGVAVPAKTPRAIVDRLHAETQKALAVPAVQERLATLGVEPKPMTVDEFGKFYRDDVAAIVKLARDVNLAPTN